MTLNIGFFLKEFATMPPFKFTSSSKDPGGVDKSLLNLIKNLDENKYECNVISTGDKKNLQIESPSKNLNLYRFPSLNSYINSDNQLMSKLISPDFVLGPKKLDLDLIHCHLGHPGTECPALVYKKKNANVPFLLSIRGLRNSDWGSKYRQYLMKFYVKSIYSKVLEVCDAIVVQSKGILRESNLINQYRDKVHIVPNGVHFETYSKFNNKNNINISILEGINKYENILLFVGNLVEGKGVHTLLDSFERILNDHSSTGLVIVGKGPLKKYIKDRARKKEYIDKVYLTGYISNKKRLAKIYSFSDLFVFPSLSEGFPRVLLESMAAGTPCLVSNIGPNYSAIGEGEYGLVAEVKNSKDFAAKIIKYFEMDEKMKKILRTEGVDYAKKHSWADVAKEMEAIYKKLLE